MGFCEMCNVGYTAYRIYCDHVSALLLTPEKHTSECRHGSSRLVSTEDGGRVSAVLKVLVLVLVCDVGDVLCPSGRAGFSPNPRAPQQGSPRLLIAAPLLAPPHSWPPQRTNTQTPATRKQVYTQHQQINCRALCKIS